MLRFKKHVRMTEMLLTAKTTAAQGCQTTVVRTMQDPYHGCRQCTASLMRTSRCSVEDKG